MIIDVRKKVSALEAAKIESREVQKQFLKLGRIMAQWIDKSHTKAPHAKEEK